MRHGKVGAETRNDLTEVLAESDGIEGDYALGLLWNVERIRRDNLEFRTYEDFRELYMPFRRACLLRRRGQRRSVRTEPHRQL